MTRCKKRRVTGTRCELFRLEACGTSPFSRDFPPPGKALKCRRIFHGIFRRIGNTTGRSAVDRGFDSPGGFFMGRWRACIRRCGETRCAMRRRLEHNRDARSRLMSAYIYIYILSAKRVCVTLGAMQISSKKESRATCILYSRQMLRETRSCVPLLPLPCLLFISFILASYSDTGAAGRKHRAILTFRQEERTRDPRFLAGTRYILGYTPA